MESSTIPSSPSISKTDQLVDINEFLSDISTRLNSPKQREGECPKILQTIRSITLAKNIEDQQQHRLLLGQCFTICHHLANFMASKLVRKSANAGLRILLNGPNRGSEECRFWDDFLTLLDGFEEPQYHLVMPMLPKLEPLIEFVGQQKGKERASPANDEFSWPWLRLLFEKAIRHPNGWIRIWTLQRAVRLPSKLYQNNSEFILDCLLPAMNGIDPLWRLIERNELDGFVNSLGKMLEIAMDKNSEDKANFVCALLELLSSPINLWTGCPLYFLSDAILKAKIGENNHPNEVIFPQWRPLFAQCSNIPHVPLRMATTMNFFTFALKIHSSTDGNANKLLSMIPSKGLSHEEIPKMVEWANGILPNSDFKSLEYSTMIGEEEEAISLEVEATEPIEKIYELLGKAMAQREFDKIAQYLLRIKTILDALNVEDEHNNQMNFPRRFAVFSHLIEATFCLCQEQKKSRHYLPILGHFLSLSLHQNMLKLAHRQEDQKLHSLIEEKFSNLIDQSQLNIPIGVILAEHLFEARNNLKEPGKWAKQLVSLATFGPIIKREQRVLAFAYQQIYDKNLSGNSDGENKFLPSDSQNLLHLCAFQCRLFAIRTICLLLIREEKAESKSSFGPTIFREIITQFEELNKTKSSSFGLSMAHRRKTRLAQLLLLFVEFAKNYPGILDEIFLHCVVQLLDVNQQYSIKLLIEWTMNRILAMNSTNLELFNQFLALEKRFAKERIGSVCSWLNIYFHHLSQMQSPSIGHFRQFFSSIVPWATSQHFSNRCTALAALHLAWKKWLLPSQNEQWASEFSLISNVVQFDAGISTGNSSRIVANLCDDFYFSHFHPIRHFSLQSIFEIFPKKSGMPPDEIIPSKLLQAHFAHYFNGELEEKENFQVHFNGIICSDPKFLGAPSLIYSNLERSQQENSHKITKFEVNLTQAAEDGGVNEGKTTQSCDEVQRKFNTFGPDLHAVEVDEAESSHVALRQHKEKAELIVCASLVNKAANLGGLCRTCEIFNVRTFCIPNVQLVESVDFKALSLNAENWLHIEQVKPMDLIAYLQMKRSQGYLCVAAEQTTRSVPLESFQFPRRSILLLGDEKEGIAPELFGQVDFTVEISQLGKTRSLNVHVSAALCIHQFATQWLVKNGKTLS